MDTDLDIDMDMDADFGEDVNVPQPEPIFLSSQPQVSPPGIQSSDYDDAYQPVPTKLHLRGLDNLTSSDLKAFASEYYNIRPMQRVEWIDDSSANLVYDSTETALEALTAFANLESDVAQATLLQMIPAKTFPSHPDTRLEIRLAVAGDRKKAGARERSRFYLFNPEHDPAEQRKRERRAGAGGGRKYRDREDDGYRSQVYDDREQRRRQDAGGFDASLYDDDEAAVTARAARQDSRRNSIASFSSSEYRSQFNRQNRNTSRAAKELFPNRAPRRGSGRLRDRSASPVRDSKRDESMDGRLSSNNGSSANRLKAQIIKTTLRDKSSEPRELFPQKAAIIHRRSDAFDAADETADLFADTMSVPFVDGGSDTRLKRDLLSRITRVGQSAVRQSDTPNAANDQGGFSIRGAARQHSAGFSIRGSALTPTIAVKELFPTHSNGNAGKELFSGKLEGRGGRRQKAEDMFH